MFKIFILIIFISTSLEIENCAKEIEVCSSCISGYTLVEINSGKECIEDKTLDEINSKIENCIEISEDDNNKCNKCKRDYILSYNKKRCEYRPHCSEVDINNICISCEFPYTFNGEGECVINPPCYKMNNEKCIICQNYYNLDYKTNICQRNSSYENDHCKTKDPNDLSICLECEKDYYLNEEGKCYEIVDHCIEKASYSYKYTYLCNQCEEGYYLDETSEYDEEFEAWDEMIKCFPNPSNCIKYNGEKNKCEECEVSYYLYFDECRQGLYHCVYGNSSECSECETGYYYDDYECLEIPDKNCLSYKNIEGTWKCEKCIDKYYVDNNECKEFPDKNCKSYRIDEGILICENCENGYYFDNNQCIYYLVKNCLDYNENKCISCANGFILDSEQNICISTCKTTEKICNKCQRFYGSFDYGQTCKVLDSDKVDNNNNDDNDDNDINDISDDSEKCIFININLTVIFWFLILIY